jgi:hypothetical protein
MKPWRINRPVLEDSHHFAEDPDPILRENWIRIRIKFKRWIRIRTKGTRMRKPDIKFLVLPMFIEKVILGFGSGSDQSKRFRINNNIL